MNHPVHTSTNMINLETSGDNLSLTISDNFPNLKNMFNDYHVLAKKIWVNSTMLVYKQVHGTKNGLRNVL